MMLRPTIAELTKGEINRYELAIATAKCARAINNEYIQQREAVEKAALAGKDAAATVSVDPVLADTKAVRVAIDRIHEGRYNIVRLSDVKTEEAVEESAETTVEE
jgi:DNA-directed RNA polymerase subunit K/omega